MIMEISFQLFFVLVFCVIGTEILLLVLMIFMLGKYDGKSAETKENDRQREYAAEPEKTVLLQAEGNCLQK